MTATADAMSTKTIDVTFMVKRLKQVEGGRKMSENWSGGGWRVWG